MDSKLNGKSCSYFQRPKSALSVPRFWVLLEDRVVPVMEPHNFQSLGSVTAKVIGFFSSPNVVSTFEKFFMPLKFKEFDTTKLPAPKMKS